MSQQLTITRTLTLYREWKEILSIALDADDKSPKAQAIREALTPERVALLNEFIRTLEDGGIHLLERVVN